MDGHDSLSSYTLDARIVQKKDQLEELSSMGSVLVAPIVKEVRTGQQFLIKLHLTKNGPSHNSSIPSLRVGRRVAINTAGDPRSGPEPLTLEIGISLAKSGQIRKGACAKCCHKFGPSSPILLLLDPLSPSITDPSNYAHIDTATGSITMLAKVICSSTDHGERGNKDRYLFEFKLKRTSTMSPPSIEPLEDDGETIASCFIPPVMCSGHHKAKRVYPPQRPSKITKGTSTSKAKTIKRQRGTSNSAIPCNVAHHAGEHPGGYISAESISNISGLQSSVPLLSDRLPRTPVARPYSDVPNAADKVDHTESSDSQPHMPPAQHPPGPVPPAHPQCPRITEVRPDHGPIRKTTDVFLRGTFFHEGMIPYFGCFPAEDVVVEAATLIICKAPKSPLPGTVSITIHDNVGNSFTELGQYTYLDDSETELLILQLQLRLAHRALEYLHAQATGRKGNAADILKGIPGLASSPHSASLLMDNMDHDSTMDPNQPILSLQQVEQAILNTLDHLPRAIDISEQLEDGSSLLHLSILLGFDRLAIRLVEEGCELELMDAWLMTPLMYAVLKGNEIVVRVLVNAGASSAGAETPREFYDRLPFEAHTTLAMDEYLSISCTRFWSVDSVCPSIDTEEESDAIEAGSDEEKEPFRYEAFDGERHRNRHTVSPPTSSTAPATPVIRNSRSEAQSDGSELMAQLADTIQGVRINHGIPPLDQQHLPPLHTVEMDGTITINTNVVQGIELAESVLLGNDMYRNANPESGYHSGVYTEVRERLSLLNKATLPHEGLKMTVLMKKLSASNPSPISKRLISSSSAPRELFRTGDTFGIEIGLSTVDPSGTNDQYLPLPKEFIGVKFPHNMVKGVGGRPAVLLSEMTYILKVTIELGRSSTNTCAGSCSTADIESESTGANQGDGIPLSGSCQACSKFLHEHRNLSPSPKTTSGPSLYPILQFSIPGGLSSTTSSHQEPVLNQDTNSSGVVELRDGLCEVKAKVNCSSMHQLLQRERIRCTEELRLQQQGLSSPSSSHAVPPTESAKSIPDSLTRTAPLAMADIQDLGYVFKFELIHPSLNTVVSYYETNPIMFQSYARGRT
ncbi:SPT3 Dosage dependent suppressor of Ty-induced promoter mutations-like protein [Haplosporangium sp. Z 767]|nr:SPT3 Dosage dependent suppressor of Ty-induced promoter mutations-like protein [Haplosporangium sp. Z 767]